MKLRSGREIDAHKEIIGISPDLTVYDGYDGVLVRDDPYCLVGEDLDCADRMELADEMIRRWESFKDASMFAGAESRGGEDER